MTTTETTMGHIDDDDDGRLYMRRMAIKPRRQQQPDDDDDDQPTHADEQAVRVRRALMRAFTMLLNRRRPRVEKPRA